MKSRLLTLLHLLLVMDVFAQLSKQDSLKINSLQLSLGNAKEDSVKVNILIELSKLYNNTTSGTRALDYATEARELAEKIAYPKGKASALKYMGMVYFSQDNLVFAMDAWDQALTIYDSLKEYTGISNMLNNEGSIFFMNGNTEKALEYYQKSLAYSKIAGDTLRQATALNNIGSIYMENPATYDLAIDHIKKSIQFFNANNDKENLFYAYMNLSEIYFKKNDEPSALAYFKKAQDLPQDMDTYAEMLPHLSEIAGHFYLKKGDHKTALSYYKEALEKNRLQSNQTGIASSLFGIGSAYLKLGKTALALQTFKESELIAKKNNQFTQLIDIYTTLNTLYAAKGDYLNAFKYQSLNNKFADTLSKINVKQKIDGVSFNSMLAGNEQQKKLSAEKNKHELAISRIKYTNNLKLYSLLIGLSGLLILASVLYRNNQQKKKTNLLLQQQKSEIEKTLADLKIAQNQLVQSEKMASLGELTAGIAHEIQNPLNFVNNFSEINKELIDEMHQEIARGNLEEVKNIGDLIKGNQDKISQHGKRADAIVKGMLQHSRTSTGQQEPTDINTLVDEYLKLAYHGLRAKDKSFNVSLDTSFDQAVGKVHVIPQDIGRVFLNIINNAFYIVAEKKKQQLNGYEPKVSVHTKKLNGKIEVSITDNGNGIPPKALDKIFQPFFTTKPTGQGTGLGLSLSYDIIKAHGGEIKVQTKEGEGTEFIIQVPILA